MKWENCTPENFSGKKPFVCITDNVEPYCATLPTGATVEDAINDFCQGYEYSPGGTKEGLRQEIRVTLHGGTES